MEAVVVLAVVEEGVDPEVAAVVVVDVAVVEEGSKRTR